MSHHSDLVRDSKLNTSVRGDITRHLIPTSDRDDQRRLIQKEERWKRVGLLGEGTFGLVWKETLERGQSDVQERAVKMIKKRPGQVQTIDYTRELEAIAKFSGREYGAYFVQSFGWYESPDAVFITMEFFEHGDLQHYLDTLPSGGTIPEVEAQIVAYQILEGLEIMHKNGFAHRDLKPANVLIRRTGDHERGWWVKIGDFGISKRAKGSLTALRTFGGTAGFLAPEILAQSGLIGDEYLGGKCEYTVSVDIWAMGETIHRVLTGLSPFGKGLGAYIRGFESFPTQLLKNIPVSDSGIDLVEKLMKPSPDERLTAAKALKHTWFNAFIRENDSPRSSGEFVNIGTIKSDLLSPIISALPSGQSSYRWSEASAKWSTISDATLPKKADPSMANLALSEVDLSSPPALAASVSKTSYHFTQTSVREQELSISENENKIRPPTLGIDIDHAPGSFQSHLVEETGEAASTEIKDPLQPQAFAVGSHEFGQELRDVQSESPEIHRRPMFFSYQNSSKGDRKKWWEFSKRKSFNKECDKGVFGVPVVTSSRYANVPFLGLRKNGKTYLSGYILTVVSKTALFLREKATDVEFIFQQESSEKIIDELKAVFDTPPRYGRSIDWSSYTVQDAANVMKLYFDSLPEPVVPFSHYDDFRTPLGGQHAQVVGTRAPLAYQEIGYFHPDNAIRIYRKLIRNLPPVNRQLLVYMLYFFAVFADKSNTNKATPSVLARSFQRGILSHPRHIDSDKDKKLNQDVIIFLIVKHHFLLGSLDL